ncbi:formate dehydrogenase accessory sulfurtransferase FdhD, partial [Psychrobacter sp. 16-Bac2893]
MANKPHLAAEDSFKKDAPLSRLHVAYKHSYASDTFLDAAKKAPLDIDTKSGMLAVEAAVAIVINGIHYAVLMASPYQLEYLAIGFLYSEGLIQHSHELLDWDITQLTDDESYPNFTPDSFIQNSSNKDSLNSNVTDELISLEQLSEQLQDYDIYVVELVLNQRCHQRIQAQKRQLAGRTGCGMCGITGLTQALPDLSKYQINKLLLSRAMPSLDDLLSMQAQINVAQHTHQLTGAVHAAATLYEQQLYLFEDVGRHNALDKLIGWQ